MTKLLLDSHVFIWMHAEPERISRAVQALLTAPETALFLSVVVPWELGIKVLRQRLTLPEPLGDYFTSRVERARMNILPITLHHVLDAVRLPPHHSDPFDRMLVAQARVERLALVSADPEVARYDVELLRPS